MTPVASDRDSAAALAPVSLTSHEVSRLRAASAWARFLAVVGFIASGLMGLAFVGLAASGLAHGGGNGSLAAFSFPLLFALLSVGSAAWLLWGFGRSVLVFLQGGAPTTLTRAFRNLRQFFKLWTFVIALTALARVLSLFDKL